MKLSKYIIPINDCEPRLLYNTINGSIIKIKSPIHSISEWIQSVPASDVLLLRKLGYVVGNEQDEQVKLREIYGEQKLNFDSTLYLTVEITTSCNFTCQFCYQASWESRKKISEYTVREFLRVIDNSDLSGYKTIHLNIIGGEPFLFPEVVIKLCNQVFDIAIKNNLGFACKLNSNGYNLSPEMISEFRNMTFMFPFLAPCDYEKLVQLKNKKTNLREDLLSRIRSWVPIMNAQHDNLIVFRLNINEQNISYFEQYINEIKSFNFDKFEIALINTADCDFNHYNNQIDTERFNTWYIEQAIPILKEYGISLPIRPRNELSRCKARRKGSFKLFADGRIGLCNGIEYDSSMPYIKDIDCIDDINNIFYDIKSYHYLNDDKCFSCNKVFLCGGPSHCKGRICRGEIENVIRYAKAIVK